MDKSLSYVEKSILGGWEDNNYSFAFMFNDNGGANHAAYTNKKLFPNTGSMGKFWIKEEVDCFSLQIMFFQDDRLLSTMILKIVGMDGTSLKIRLLNNEVISLAKVA